MRIISGKYRGKKLAPPEGFAVRPTADRVREALFNILQFEVPGSSVLDLFAGSGALGIEAISRGCAKAVFGDADTALVKRNLQAVGETAAVITGDYQQVIDRLARSGERFDIVFLDPPYRAELAESAVRRIDSENLLYPEGVIVWEHIPADVIRIGDTSFEVTDTRTYGKTALSFIRRK